MSINFLPLSVFCFFSLKESVLEFVTTWSTFAFILAGLVACGGVPMLDWSWHSDNDMVATFSLPLLLVSLGLFFAILLQRCACWMHHLWFAKVRIVIFWNISGGMAGTHACWPLCTNPTAFLHKFCLLKNWCRHYIFRKTVIGISWKQGDRFCHQKLFPSFTIFWVMNLISWIHPFWNPSLFVLCCWIFCYHPLLQLVTS